MHVTLGLKLDRRLGPCNQDTLDQPVVGPLGLLGLLETWLGLSRPEVSTAQRVTSYLGHLRKQAAPSRFYGRSLQADSVGTSAKLLSWRDDWRLGGWDGTAPAGSPRRLVDMAEVEQIANSNIPPGQAERLAAVVAALETERTPIESVRLVDPLDSFPRAWREVLARLPEVRAWEPEPQGEGLLRELQKSALEGVTRGELRPLVNPIADGSIVLVQSSSREAAEHWLSAYCRQTPTDRLLVCESDGDSVDATMMATGGASSGFRRVSSLRPALQALGLALEMGWDPVDVGRLVEFLSHPVGPFPRKARVRLAKAVAEQPGLGGGAWESAKQEIHGTENGEAILEDIAFWLEGERWNRDAGAPVDALLARVEKLADALRKRLADDGLLNATLGAAIEQCSAVRDGLLELKSQGAPTIAPRMVEQLLEHATPMSAGNPFAPAQVGCLRAESDAAACIDSADEVIWWMPSTPQLPLPLEWTKSELATLRDLGVEVRDPQSELELLSRQWLRPLLVARRRFVMVLPPPGAEEHPVRQLLLKLWPDLKEQLVNLDAQVSNGFVGTLAENVTRTALPPAPQSLELGEPVTVPTTDQSYTSMSELFNAPALYAFKRIARMRPASILEARDGNNLLGTLAHRVFEKLFQQAHSLNWTDEQAVAWFRDNVDSLLRTEGAILLMRGAGVSLQRFRSVCEHAIRSMMRHLRAAKATRVHTELPVAGKLGDLSLIGKIDLLVELAGGQAVALDMKWRGDKRYADALHDGQHLQLAVYSSLYQQQAGVAPAALGYFILETGAMYVSAPDVIPTAQVRTPPPAATASLIEQARASWSWRASQWAEGHIDVVPVGGGEDFNGPEGTLPVNGPNAWDKDYMVLLGGWEQ
ncbi:TPA: PD-(D/E)XK nuclease family protein [Burkholderia vietnamiensis]|uniref:PD-(D/E)XK nuclease family protein n=1 Tax=Burkholderia vietnamiensis TaxID=60552 RepID=UPI001B965422|nr:PD-(D/E)XK nuclease family protein [Burkholderia vietnamiensis]MBR8165300.1 PD-(D/E)XK nuclease family protein [Burkholderia vietnamiensis]MCA8146112.1 PD-(D/E)XK nuclease family protein [Burkholderia vietnamiensis]HDR8948758.1 PD-(D/E)XK nuclease family protein [Burkholderia vietnamiensis]HDR9179295.1 PD-(D/E)XK nuclease family protein [Burkholderia vietnamiensis]HDR9228795.1 PD-(D/E)XK nuclease family protein [Burkholderia vietnamiensis]